MIEKKQDRDARWRGPLALFIVGLSVALIATALPEDGATIMGQRFSVQLPDTDMPPKPPSSMRVSHPNGHCFPWP